MKQRTSVHTHHGRLATLWGGVLMLLLPVFSSSAGAQKFRVITTFTVIQDMAQNIAGEAALVESLTKPGAEIHGYQPTPQDIVKVQSANLVLWNGLGLERWFERFFENIENVPAAVVSEGIVPLAVGAGQTKSVLNPHAWMSPANALVYVENIRKALVHYDPVNATVYNQNAKAYAVKITQLDAPWRQRLAPIPAARRWLVSSEGAFGYLAAAYGFQELWLWPVNAEEQGSPQQIRRVIDSVRAHHIPVVFSESTISDKPAIQISRETGARYGGVLYVDSLSDARGPVHSYIDLMSVTLETIAQGFGQ